MVLKDYENFQLIWKSKKHKKRITLNAKLLCMIMDNIMMDKSIQKAKLTMMSAVILEDNNTIHAMLQYYELLHIRITEEINEVFHFDPHSLSMFSRLTFPDFNDATILQYKFFDVTLYKIILREIERIVLAYNPNIDIRKKPIKLF